LPAAIRRAMSANASMSCRLSNTPRWHAARIGPRGPVRRRQKQGVAIRPRRFADVSGRVDIDGKSPAVSTSSSQSRPERRIERQRCNRDAGVVGGDWAAGGTGARSRAAISRTCSSPCLQAGQPAAHRYKSRARARNVCGATTTLRTTMGEASGVSLGNTDAARIIGKSPPTRGGGRMT